MKLGAGAHPKFAQAKNNSSIKMFGPIPLAGGSLDSPPPLLLLPNVAELYFWAPVFGPFLPTQMKVGLTRSEMELGSGGIHQLGESQNNYSRKMFGPIPLARGGLEATLPFGFLSIAADRFSDVLDKVHYYPPA